MTDLPPAPSKSALAFQATGNMCVGSVNMHPEITGTDAHQFDHFTTHPGESPLIKPYSDRHVLPDSLFVRTFAPHVHVELVESLRNSNAGKTPPYDRAIESMVYLEGIQRPGSGTPYRRFVRAALELQEPAGPYVTSGQTVDVKLVPGYMELRDEVVVARLTGDIIRPNTPEGLKQFLSFLRFATNVATK